MPKIIKTIKIASIVVACLAVFLLALPAFSGDGSGEKSEGSKTETIFEKHKRIRGQAALAETGQVAPLIKEAKDFALYLDPPPPPPNPVQRNQARRQVPSGMAPVNTAPKQTAARFDVLATCVNKVNPQASLALIYLNGKERQWVRQSSKIGHITVKEIYDGYVMLEDATRTFRKDMINQMLETSLLTSEQANLPAENSILESMQRNQPETVTEAVNTPRRSGLPTTSPVQKPIAASARQNPRRRAPAPQMSPEEEALVEKFFTEIASMQIEDTNNPAENKKNVQKTDEAINEFFREIGEMHIDANEVQDLDELGEKLDGAGRPLE